MRLSTCNRLRPEASFSRAASDSQGWEWSVWEDVTFSAADDGFGFTLGAGYDFGFGGRFGLTPHADFNYGAVEDASTNLVRFGLGFNWY